MLLRQIISQLDGELVRLRSLRDVVAGLAKPSPAVRRLAPQLERLFQAAPMAGSDRGNAAQELKAESAKTVKPARALAESGAASRPMRGRRRSPRSAADAATRPEPTVRAHRSTRPAEPTALGKAASAGPVVISAAALVREREARMAIGIPLPHSHTPEAGPEVRPEAFARELAARWLLSPGKGSMDREGQREL